MAQEFRPREDLKVFSFVKDIQIVVIKNYMELYKF